MIEVFSWIGHFDSFGLNQKGSAERYCPWILMTTVITKSNLVKYLGGIFICSGHFAGEGFATAAVAFCIWIIGKLSLNTKLYFTLTKNTQHFFAWLFTTTLWALLYLTFTLLDQMSVTKCCFCTLLYHTRLTSLNHQQSLVSASELLKSLVVQCTDSGGQSLPTSSSASITSVILISLWISSISLCWLDWCWLMLINADWCWLMLIDADWY